jgi:hypothetical protein
LAILQGGGIIIQHPCDDIYSMEEAIANLKLALDDKSFTILQPSIHPLVCLLHGKNEVYFNK